MKALPCPLRTGMRAQLFVGQAKEDYVLPDAHTVAIRIAPEQRGGVAGECTWTWQPRKAGGKAESKRMACKDMLTIPRVPYRARSRKFRRLGEGWAARWPRDCRR